MEMMLDLDELPVQPFPLPFQYLSDSPFMEFSGGSSAVNHPTPPPHPPLLHRYPSPFIMQSQPTSVTDVSKDDFFINDFSRRDRTLREFPPGKYWLHQKPESMETMREMVFRMAALQPVHIDPESIKPTKRRNVKISSDPQTVAARHRRERISERIKILQRLVPGGTKMDTASMLDEAAHYMKFLKKQVESLEQAAAAGGAAKTSSSPQSSAVNISGCCPTGAANSSYHSHLVGSGQPAT